MHCKTYSTITYKLHDRKIIQVCGKTWENAPTSKAPAIKGIKRIETTEAALAYRWRWWKQSLIKPTSRRSATGAAVAVRVACSCWGVSQWTDSFKQAAQTRHAPMFFSTTKVAICLHIPVEGHLRRVCAQLARVRTWCILISPHKKQPSLLFPTLSRWKIRFTLNTSVHFPKAHYKLSVYHVCVMCDGCP